VTNVIIEPEVEIYSSSIGLYVARISMGVKYVSCTVCTSIVTEIIHCDCSDSHPEVY
jgi:hypothetical protein